MNYENKIGGTFDNLAQRIIYPYIITYPDFVPVNGISESAQKQMHDFMKSALITVYNNPEIIGMPAEKDDCFGEGEAKKDKPELYNTLRKLEKNFLSFFTFLFELGLYGDVVGHKLHVLKSQVPVNKSKLVMLSQFGLTCELDKEKVIVYNNNYSELCAGWKLLCCHAGADGNSDFTIKSVAGLLFMKCLFENTHISLSRIYGDLKQSGEELKELEKYLFERGYEYTEHDGNYFLIRRCKGNKDGKFKVLFDSHKKNQLSYCFEIPGFTKLMTNHYNEMDDELKAFVFPRLNKCSHCDYCKKTGKRELVSLKLKLDNITEEKCPLYAGFWWGELYDENVSQIKKLIEFAVNKL